MLLTFSLASRVDLNTIQDGSEEKVNIFGGDNFGQCEEEVHTNTCLVKSEWLPRYSCLNQQIQNYCEWQYRKEKFRNVNVNFNFNLMFK